MRIKSNNQVLRKCFKHETKEKHHEKEHCTLEEVNMPLQATYIYKELTKTKKRERENEVLDKHNWTNLN